MKHTIERVRTRNYFGTTEAFDSRGRATAVHRDRETSKSDHFRSLVTPQQRALWRLCTYVPMLAAIAWPGFIFAFIPNGPIFSLHGLAACVLMLVPCILAFAAIRLVDHKIKVPAIVMYRLRQMRCGCCDYGIGAISPEADGCTVCPECGAAWKLDRESAAQGSPNGSR